VWTVYIYICLLIPRKTDNPIVYACQCMFHKHLSSTLLHTHDKFAAMTRSHCTSYIETTLAESPLYAVSPSYSSRQLHGSWSMAACRCGLSSWSRIECLQNLSRTASGWLLAGRAARHESVSCTLQICREKCG
jgi:hypothetical protein